MKKGIVWLLLGAVIAAVVLQSCGAPAPSTGTGTTVTSTAKPAATTGAAPAATTQPAPTSTTAPAPVVPDVPQYGGTATIAFATEDIFYPGVMGNVPNWIATIMFEPLTMGNWARGPSGTKEFSYFNSPFPGYSEDEGLAGALAVSWEVLSWDHYVMKLRPGARFMNKAPAFGREVTADDWVASINWQQQYVPRNIFKVPAGTPEEKQFRPTALDKYTLDIKGPYADPARGWIIPVNTFVVLPRELVADYISGKQDPTDWKNWVGTGPYIITDRVQGSSVTLGKNNDFWEDDPLHPELKNRLPYLDGVQALIIPDLATQFSSLRVGKIDRLWNVSRTDALPLIQSNPTLKYGQVLSLDHPILMLRNDREPFTKLEVRQAMNLAINFPSIKDQYYGGNAVIVNWISRPGEATYTPWEELPQNIKELFSYNPDRAKKMLADAGYANGFEFTANVLQKYSEQASLFVEYLQQVGITMKLNIVDATQISGMKASKNFEGVLFERYGQSSLEGTVGGYFKGGFGGNYTMVDDPKLQEQYTKGLALPRDQQVPVFKQMNLYAIEQVYQIPFAAPYDYILWQPWIKNYTGELWAVACQRNGFVRYTWIDQKLKTSLGK